MPCYCLQPWFHCRPAAERYAALEPQRGTMSPGWIANGDHLLDLLSQTMGNHDQAVVHLEDALAWTCHDYADALG